MTSLHEYLDAQEQTENERFQVDTDQKANWALRKIKQFKDQQKEISDLADKEIEKFKAWEKQERKKAQDSIDYFQSLLANYAMIERELDPKFKTRKLPNGALKFRKQQPEYVFNNDQMIDYLKKSGHDGFIRVKEEPDKAEIKKHFQVHDKKLIDPDTGEFIAGATVQPREDKFIVEVED